MKKLALLIVFAATVAVAQSGPAGSSLDFIISGTGVDCDPPTVGLGVWCVGPTGALLSLNGGAFFSPETTVSVGTTTTAPNGTPASVTNSGTANAAVLNFVIPAGPAGGTGPAGQNGAPGAAATIAVGTTTTGTTASVTNVGTSSAAIFNFVIPQGVMPTTCQITISKARVTGGTTGATVTGTATFSGCN